MWEMLCKICTTMLVMVGLLIVAVVVGALVLYAMNMAPIWWMRLKSRFAQYRRVRA